MVGAGWCVQRRPGSARGNRLRRLIVWICQRPGCRPSAGGASGALSLNNGAASTGEIDRSISTAWCDASLILLLLSPFPLLAWLVVRPFPFDRIAKSLCYAQRGLDSVQPARCEIGSA